MSHKKFYLFVACTFIFFIGVSFDIYLGYQRTFSFIDFDMSKV